MGGAVESRDDHDVAYVTDVEGMWPRLASFCANNAHVTLTDGGGAVGGDILVVKPGATFVFGGDAIDRGPWSRRIVRTLLDAKARQPDQVVLLAGNRDLNKLRLAREIEGHPPKRAPEEMHKAPRAELLKWIMKNTMGAADAFEFRRGELAHERNVAREAVADEEVAQSYVDDLKASGELARYLDRCQLTWRSGRTLFVHGGIAEEALTVVPGTPDGELKHFDVDKWRERLERFYRDQIAAFHAREIEPDGTPAWESAILYQAPRKGMKLNPGSVVYGRMSDEHNNPTLPKKDVVDALVRSGISRVVVGHTPSGDTPSLVRTSEAPFEIVNADNSRSRVDTGSKVFIRDEAVTLHGRVITDDNAAHDLANVAAADDKDAILGRRTVDGGALVKGRVHDGWLLFRYLPDYVVTQRVVADVGAVEDPVEPIPPPVPTP